MLGFLIGTVCLIGLIRTLRRGSCGGGWGYRNYGYGGACGSRWSGGGGGYFGGHGPWEGGHDNWQGGPFRTHARAGFRRGGGGYGMGNFVLRRLFEALDTSPGQEKVIAAAFEELRAEAAKHRGEVRKSREDLAKALRSPSFDETAMGELFARHDTALEALRKAVVGAMAKVHEALEPEQRTRLADLIEQTPGFWGAFGGRGVEI
jgi:Spy/CpxP family protein refolding chaperone